MIELVRETIEQYHMLQNGDTVVAGVSGGADSSALLHVLVDGLRELHLLVVVCHINHQLRGTESERDMRFVKTLCETLSVPCHVLTKDVRALAAKCGLGEEACGRELRYHFFKETAARYGNHVKIATAHTLSDNAETVLFRMARGTGLRGLCGIPPVRGDIIRPLLGVTREQVERYCAEQGIGYVTDSTNASPDYARNRLRLHAVPELKTVNPSFEQSLLHTVETLRQDEEYLTEQAVRALCEADEGDGFSAEALRALASAVRGRALMIICRENGIPAEREKIEALNQIITGKHGKISIAAGRYVQVCRGLLCFTEKQEPSPHFEIPFQCGRLTLPSGVTYNSSVVTDWKPMENVNKNFSIGILDYDKIKGKLVFRSRKSGDVLSLPQRGLTKPLRKLYNEAGIPPQRRGLLSVLCDEQGPVWAEGFGVDARAVSSGNTKRFLVLERTEDGEKQA